jgi:hypothetical protein
MDFQPSYFSFEGRNRGEDTISEINRGVIKRKRLAPARSAHEVSSATSDAKEAARYFARARCWACVIIREKQSVYC